MSDPVSNHDIEDVLSSIRRLVAQGDPRRMEKPANVPTPLHPEPPVTSSKQDELPAGSYADRLVLTPAFRVLDDDEAGASDENTSFFDGAKSVDAALKTPESDTIPTKDPRPMPPPGQSPSERESLEATIAELEAAVSSGADEWEPDGSEVVSATVFSSAFKSKIESARLSLLKTNTDTQPDTSEDAVTSAVADHIADTVAEELQDAFPHLQAADEAHDLETVDEAAAAEDATVEAEELHIETDDEPDDVVASEAASSQELIEPEVVAEQESRVITPTFRHASFQEVYDPVAEATADAAEAAPDAGDLYGDELAPDPEDAMMGSAVANPAGTHLMDRDMMREMVSQMIREELQGEMGERITRNVRKLVRREINRVISAQEFE